MRPDYRLLSDVKPEEVHWLWKPYIPLGEVTLLAGDGGVGKTFIGLNWAARLSNGDPLDPVATCRYDPRKTIYFTAEDSPAHTIRPRAEAMGANLKNIAVMDMAGFHEGSSWFDKTLEAAREIQPSLIIFDPIQAFLPPKADMNKLVDARQHMRQFSQIARKVGCAVVVIAHLNKAVGNKAQHRVTGSTDIVNAAKSTLIAGNVTSGDRSKLILTQAKANLGPKGKSWEYRIEEDLFEWVGLSSLGPEDVSSGVMTGQLEKAKEFLLDALSGGPVPSTELESLAAARGISKRTLARAKTEIGVESSKEGSEWFCSIRKVA